MERLWAVTRHGLEGLDVRLLSDVCEANGRREPGDFYGVLAVAASFEEARNVKADLKRARRALPVLEFGDGV